MKGTYAGVLRADDPLLALLAKHISSTVADSNGRDFSFDVHHLDAAGIVYLYRERRTEIRLVAKFYGNKPVSSAGDKKIDWRGRFLQQELSSICTLHSIGFSEPPIRVVRPLGIAHEINHVLLLEHVPGHDLQSTITAIAAGKGDPTALRREIAAAARFLAQLHSRTRTAKPLDGADALSFLDKMIEAHHGLDLFSDWQRRQACEAAARWSCEIDPSSDRQALIHGDATPPHFIFDPLNGDLTVIDLERVWLGDPAKDLGCLAAELTCTLWSATGDSCASEPFREHLWNEYLRALDSDPGQTTRRAEFYEGCYQMRIARNGWIPMSLKREFIDDGLRRIAGALAS